MPSLNNANHRNRVIRALERAGLLVDAGGKHAIVYRTDGTFVSVIPRAPGIKPGTLRAILKQCGIAEEDYLMLYAGKRPR